MHENEFNMEWKSHIHRIIFTLKAYGALKKVKPSIMVHSASWLKWRLTFGNADYSQCSSVELGSACERKELLESVKY